MLYSFAVLIALMMSISTGIGPSDAGDPVPSPLQQNIAHLGQTLSYVFVAPIMIIHDTFFMGRPLPGNDWLWIILMGLIYGVILLAIKEKILFRRSQPKP